MPLCNCQSNRNGFRARLLFASSLFATLLALTVVGLFAGQAWSAELRRPTAAKAPAATWQIRESKNFRVLTYAAEPVSEDVVASCETLRGELCQKWLASASDVAWSPKCDIVLHPNDASYLREVGQGGGTTVAASLVDQRHGKILGRRIDVRSATGAWRESALPHELTHVVLADRFAGRALPRWIDEGLAILADPAHKQARHQHDLTCALAARSTFRTVELMTLEDYPAAQRWGVFYGQSASLVKYLVESGTPQKFVDFAEQATQHGYETALRNVYAIDSVADLERRWQRSVRSTNTGSSSRQVATAETPAQPAAYSLPATLAVKN